MQKWYDDGYFAADLPMKRLQYDNEWSTVGELVQRSTGDKVFLSPLRPVAPPGLTKRDSTSLHPINQSVDSIFSNPYQPSPIRSLRSSTLDSFNGSNPSESPSSSLGHFGNGSPDPLAYGGIVGNGGNAYGLQEGIGQLGFGGGVDLSGMRRNHLQDYAQDPRIHSPSYGNMLNHPFGSNYPNQYSSVQSSPWGTAHDPFTNYNANYNAPGYNAHSVFNTQLPNQVIGNQVNPLLYGGADLNQLNAPTNEFVLPGTAVNQVGVNELQSLGQGSGSQYQPPSNPTEVNAHDQADLLPVPPSPKSSAPAAWESIQSTVINTTVPATPSQPSPWSQPQQPAPVPKEASPWVLASQGVLETPWQPPVESEVAATVVRLEKAEEPQELHGEPVAAEAPALPTPAASPPVEISAPTTKSAKKHKSVVPAPAPVSAPTSSSPASVSPSPSPAPTPSLPAQKAPWAKDEKKKAKAAPTVSLRQIQDAEAKAAEARKTKEEKERVGRLATPASAEVKEDSQPFTTSWGLPTSQAGSRTVSLAKDAPAGSPTPATISSAVWTNAPKPAVKKTMKEIQEEEERRKKAAPKETVAAAAAKRAYAETTTKVSRDIVAMLWST
jgi:PERQ amino acid-rich with GYF domain-containing protein